MIPRLDIGQKDSCNKRPEGCGSYPEIEGKEKRTIGKPEFRQKRLQEKKQGIQKRIVDEYEQEAGENKTNKGLDAYSAIVC